MLALLKNKDAKAVIHSPTEPGKSIGSINIVQEKDRINIPINIVNKKT